MADPGFPRRGCQDIDRPNEETGPKEGCGTQKHKWPCVASVKRMLAETKDVDDCRDAAFIKS